MGQRETTFKHSPAAVVLGLTATGLSIVRSLGRRGIPVCGVGNYSEAGMYSRYCRTEVGPAVLEEEEKFLELLTRIGERYEQKPILYTAADEYISCVSKHRERMSRYFRFNIPERWIVDSFLDKSKSYQVAEKCGLSYPLSFLISSLEEAKTCSQQLRFPCILKPVYSHLWRQKYGAVKAIIVHSPEEAVQAYQKLQDEGWTMMLQEIVTGPDSDIYCVIAYYDKAGTLAASFCKRKLRQYPIHFGVSSFCLGEHNQEVIDASISFFKQINYTGLGGLELKRDSRDGKLKFTELNVRLLMTGDVTVHSGVDFPYIYYRDLCEQAIEPVHYREGVKLTNIFLDISSFWHYRSLKEITFWQWLKSYRGTVYDTYFAWDDLKPFLYTVLRYFKTIPRKIKILVFNAKRRIARA